MIRFLLIFLQLSYATCAQIVVQHIGAAPPNSLDWERCVQGSGVVESSLTNEGGSALGAWAIDDGSAGPDFIYYSRVLATNEQRVLNSNGWRLRVIVRVVDFPTPVDGASSTNNSIAVRVRVGELGCDFDLILGSGMSDGIRSIIANNIYHAVEDYAEIVVEYLPAFGEWGDSSLDMWINGSKRLGGFRIPPNGSGTPYIAWGCFGGSTVGHGAWREVTFEALPPVEKPRITSVEFEPSRVCLQVADVRRGVYYQIEETADLAAVPWTRAMGYRPSLSGVARWYINRGFEPVKFYRVRTK